LFLFDVASFDDTCVQLFINNHDKRKSFK